MPQSRVRHFRNEYTSSTHGTLNSRFREYHSVWVHLGMFRYYTKLGASWAETGAIIEKSSCHEVV